MGKMEIMIAYAAVYYGDDKISWQTAIINERTVLVVVMVGGGVAVMR